jgi:hypothetical protein
VSYTKQQFVEGALGEIGMAAYIFDLTAEQLEDGMHRLDVMMATWSGRGIRLGYPLPASPGDSQLSQDTGVPDSAYEAIIANLAVRLAPGYGKQVAPETKAVAKGAYDVLLAKATMPHERKLPSTMPAGAGNQNWNAPFVPEAEETISGGPSPGALPWEE